MFSLCDVRRRGVWSRRVTWMLELHMCLECCHLACTVRAVGTLKGFLAGVDHVVTLHIFVRTEQLITNRTRVDFNSFRFDCLCSGHGVPLWGPNPFVCTAPWWRSREVASEIRECGARPKRQTCALIWRGEKISNHLRKKYKGTTLKFFISKN